MADTELTLGIDSEEALDGIKDLARALTKVLDKVAKDASADLDDVSDAAEETSKKVGSSFDGIGKAALAAGAAIAGFFAGRALINGVRGVVEAANIQEDAINALNTSLKLAGDFSQEASQDIQDFATNLQAITTVGDETTLSLFALAKNFSLSNEETKNLTQAAIELSAATGIELESAVRNLGKTTAGLAGELGESIPQIRELGAEALKSGAAIQLVLDRFGGAAAAQVQTFSGATQQLSNVFGDLQEEIGFIITQNPQLIAAINEISRIIQELTRDVSDNRDEFSGSFGTIIEVVIGFVKDVVIAFQSLKAGINDAKLGFFILSRDILNALAQPKRGLNQLESDFFLFFASITRESAAFVDGLIDNLKEIPGISTFLPDIEEAQSTVANFSESIAEGFELGAAAALKQKTRFDDLESAAEDAIQEQSRANREYLATSNALIDGLADLERKVIAAGDKTVDLSDKAKDAYSKQREEVKKLSDEAKKAAEEQEKNTQRISDFLDDLGRKALPLVEQLELANTDLAEAFAENDADAVISTYQEILRLQGEITKEVLDRQDKERKAAEEAKKRFEAERDAFVREGLEGAAAVGSAFLGSAGGAADNSREIEALTAEIRELREVNEQLGSAQQAGVAVAGDQDRLEIVNQIAEKEKQLAQLREQQGEQAAGFVNELASVVGEVILPGFGGLIGQLTAVLTSGPEAAAAFIQGIIEGLPDIITNLALATPEIIAALIEGLPDIITALSVQLPVELTKAFIQQLPRIVEAQITLVPRIVQAFAKEIASQIYELDFDLSETEQKIKEIFTFLGDGFEGAFREFGDVISDAGSSFFNSIIDGGKQFIQNLIDEIKDAFGGSGTGGGENNRRLLEGIFTGGLSEVDRATGGNVRRELENFGDTLGINGLRLDSDQPTGPRLGDDLPSFEDRSVRLREEEPIPRAQITQLVTLLQQLLNRPQQPLSVSLTLNQEVLARQIFQLEESGFQLRA